MIKVIQYCLQYWKCFFRNTSLFFKASSPHCETPWLIFRSYFLKKAKNISTYFSVVLDLPLTKNIYTDVAIQSPYCISCCMWRNSFVTVLFLGCLMIAVLWTLHYWPYSVLEFSQSISLLWALKRAVLAVHKQQENIDMCLFKNVDISYQEVMHSKVLNVCIHWNIVVWFIIVVWFNELLNDLETRAAALNPKTCNLIYGSLSQSGAIAFLPGKTGNKSISLASTFVLRRGNLYVFCRPSAKKPNQISKGKSLPRAKRQTHELQTVSLIPVLPS